MRKIITIANKECQIKSSAYTQYKYKNDTGRSFLKDLSSISKIAKMSEEDQIASAEELNDILLRIAYVMIEESDPKQFTSYENFLKSLEDGLYDDSKWVEEVIETASAPLSRGIQKVPQE